MHPGFTRRVAAGHRHRLTANGNAFRLEEGHAALNIIGVKRNVRGADILHRRHLLTAVGVLISEQFNVRVITAADHGNRHAAQPVIPGHQGRMEGAWLNDEKV
ncbi:hypothetical protein GA0061070_1008105 [Kosakonia oryziphila]|uniref:Uncharacterized protein n=1 Tax=Kosakonia oryziphila TaxID=1005667 RepID=A0A1C4BQD3_9ENTR|nr:hypothetical protein GA0061070_1008105 [Kosakonia oryziphila]